MDLVRIKAADHTISGYSVSGVSSHFLFEELGLLFDVGSCPMYAASGSRSLLLSHYHADHSQCINRHWELRAMTKQVPAHYYMPASCIATVREVARIQSETREDKEYDLDLNLHAVKDGDVFTLVHKPKVSVNVFKVGHRLDSVGYTLTSEVSKLRDGVDPKDVPDLLAKGVSFKETVRRQDVTLVGDHDSTIFGEEHIWKSRVVMLECTHLDGDRAKTRRWGHTHLDDIVEALRKEDAPDCQALVLKHFSAQYKRPEIITKVTEALPDSWKSRVVLFV